MDEEEKELIDRAEKEFMKAVESDKAAIEQPEVLVNGVEEEEEPMVSNSLQKSTPKTKMLTEAVARIWIYPLSD